jgi:hypothetical protein
MHLLWLALMLFAAPFWESKPPSEWTRAELARMLNDSPWAQAASFDSRIGGATPVRALLATAQPMRDAEEQARLRAARRPDAPLEIDEDYRRFLRSDSAGHIVLAILGSTPEGMANGEETRQMEKECVMRVGRKKYKMTGHFPPSSGDPYLRLIFPRAVTDSDKEVVFEIYVPGAIPPYREVLFKVRDLFYKGKLER